MISREEYVQALRDLFSKDPMKIREANRKLYAVCVTNGGGPAGSHTEPDLVLAEAAVNS